MICMFWEECNKPSFYKHIWKPENFLQLNGKNAISPHVAEIVWKYIEENDENFHKLKQKLTENKKIIKKIHQNTIEECFSEEKSLPVANKKELVNDQDFENEKLLTDERKQKEMEEQKNRKCK